MIATLQTKDNKIPKGLTSMEFEYFMNKLWTHVKFRKLLPCGVDCKLSFLKSNSVMRLATATVETSSDYC
jgi:hypothetical protein